MFRRFIINPVCVLALLVLDSIVALWALVFGGSSGGAGGGAGVVYGSPQEAMDADDDTDFYRRAGAARSGGSGGDGDGGDRGSREGAKRPGAGPNRPAPAEGPRSSGRAPLPTDPEAAIKRLMQCRPEDFYSILNVSRTATAGKVLSFVHDCVPPCCMLMRCSSAFLFVAWSDPRWISRCAIHSNVRGGRHPFRHCS